MMGIGVQVDAPNLPNLTIRKFEEHVKLFAVRANNRFLLNQSSCKPSVVYDSYSSAAVSCNCSFPPSGFVVVFGQPARSMGCPA